MLGVYDIINNCFGGLDFVYWGYIFFIGGVFNEYLVCLGLLFEVVVDVGSIIELFCIGVVVELDGFGLDLGVEFIYEWIISDGNIVFGEFSINFIIDLEGIYIFIVYNIVIMCESMDEVMVMVDEFEVVIDLLFYIDCYIGEVVLLGVGFSLGLGIIY